jgi:VanZ family protein
MGVIFVLSSRPTGTASEIVWSDFLIKKAAHLAEYGVLSLLVYRGLINSGWRKEEGAGAAIVASLLYGVGDEWHQSFTPGRMPRVYDVVFDTMGATLAIYLLWNLLPKMPKKLRSWASAWELV